MLLRPREHLKLLMAEAQLTQEDVATRTGKDRATVANAIRLLKLEPTIQDWIEEGKLTAGHGRALLAVPEFAIADALRPAGRTGRINGTPDRAPRFAALAQRACAGGGSRGRQHSLGFG